MTKTHSNFVCTVGRYLVCINFYFLRWLCGCAFQVLSFPNCFALKGCDSVSRFIDSDCFCFVVDVVVFFCCYFLHSLSPVFNFIFIVFNGQTQSTSQKVLLFSSMYMSPPSVWHPYCPRCVQCSTHTTHFFVLIFSISILFQYAW